MPVEGTITVVTQSNELMSMGDIIAIIVAIISLLGVIVSTLLTNRTTKKISESNEKLQEKWNQKNIDASLTASARIEWIQNVRNTTADLMRYYYDILNATDSEEIEKALIDSQQKTELLALYFGPETCLSNPSTKDKNILLNTTDNTGKNDVLVSFITDLAKKIGEYASDAKDGKIERLKKAVEDARRTAYENATMEFLGYNYTEDGEKIPQCEPQFQKDDADYLHRTEDELQNATDKIRELRSDLIFLRNSMRVYLKIEWNKAKNGQ